MALLMKWLHPDMELEGQRAIFLWRVTTAWNDLKTEERRDFLTHNRRARRVKKIEWPHDRASTGTWTGQFDRRISRKSGVSLRLETQTGEFYAGPCFFSLVEPSTKMPRAAPRVHFSIQNKPSSCEEMKPHFPWFAKAFSLSVVAVFLVWQVTTRSLVAYLSSVAPEAALRLRSNDPDSLINLADKALNPYADGRSGGVPPIAPRVLETTGPTQRKNVFPGTGKSRETEEVRNKAEPTQHNWSLPPWIGRSSANKWS